MQIYFQPIRKHHLCQALGSSGCNWLKLPFFELRQPIKANHCPVGWSFEVGAGACWCSVAATSRPDVTEIFPGISRPKSRKHQNTASRQGISSPPQHHRHPRSTHTTAIKLGWPCLPRTPLMILPDGFDYHGMR